MEANLSKQTTKKKPATKAKTAAKSAAKKAAPAAKSKKPASKAKPAAKVSAKKAPAKKAVAQKAVTKKAAKKPTASKAKPAAKVSAKKAPAKKAVAQKAAPAAAKPTPKPVRLRLKKRKRVALPAGYQPSEDETFMDDRQVQYFHDKLVNWKNDIIRDTKETLAGLTEDSIQHADIADRATSETDRAFELRARDRQRKLVAKIDAALARIEDGSYGFCEDTGEPIGLKRLEARPIATLSVEAQERHERRERVYRED